MVAVGEGDTAGASGGERLSSSTSSTSSSSNSSFVADGSVRFRQVRPTDIPVCYELEATSYPEDEAASKAKLQYRQHHAARYFRCAVLGRRRTSSSSSTTGDKRREQRQQPCEDNEPGDNNNICSRRSGGVVVGDDDEDDTDSERELVGFICATRCRQFRAESMSTHVPDGELLAIHSVVIKPQYRRRGLATAMMKDYLSFVAADGAETGLSKIVLLAKKGLLSFYVDCGFTVTRASPISHGKDTWYELELDLVNGWEGRSLPPSYYVVDAFATPDGECAGNPAAVVLLDEDRDSRWMQRVALEFNLSETAFLIPQPSSPPPPSSSFNSDGDGGEEVFTYSIRYFTPTTEVPLCGHATLASAAVVFETVFVRNRADATVVFRTIDQVELRANLSAAVASSVTNNAAANNAAAAVTASAASSSSPHHPRKKRPSSYRIAMEFPAKPPVPVEDRDWVETMLQQSLQVPPQSVQYAGLSTIGDVLVELTTESFLSIPQQGWNLDVMRSCDHYSRGVIVCCANRTNEAMGGATNSSDGGSGGEEESDGPVSSSSGVVPVRSGNADFLSRFFGPKAGIDEDPVTGSAHCVLAPYFRERLDKDRLVGRQTSPRGGVVECCLVDNRTVQLTGTAVITMNGTLWL